jgi:hypothetical protein
MTNFTFFPLFGVDKMKKAIVSVCAIVLAFGTMKISEAALIDRGSGLIYCDVLDVTFLQYASPSNLPPLVGPAQLSWDKAINWVENFTYYDSVRDIIWRDWRLPSAMNKDGTGPDTGYVRNSELGHLFYSELNNPEGGYIEHLYINWGPFIYPHSPNSAGYWLETEYLDDLSQAWTFSFSDGGQKYLSKDATLRLWAVRDGDVSNPIPLPSTILLLGPALTVLSAYEWRNQRKKRA